MRRRETVLIGIAISSVAVVAVSCALNAGGIVYIVADSGPSSDSPNQTLSDGAIVEGDGAVVQPDGAPLPGKCGSDQVDIDAGFCIDKLEITNGQYLAFLIATGADGGGTGACAGDSVYQGPGVETLSHPDYPTHGMDWCAAKAYCQWAGKRLCGSVADGGEADITDAASGEWYFACSANGAKTYPYGTVNDGGGYEPTACNGNDLGEGGVVNVGSLPGCVGGYAGIHDMSGNVWEWDNACQNDTASNATCRIRGGSYMESGNQILRCDQNGTGNRNQQLTNIGIRCCSDENK
jgi:formylglycine-generating enzyme required for sulfatase activity